jgi:hypothetical protein
MNLINIIYFYIIIGVVYALPPGGIICKNDGTERGPKGELIKCTECCTLDGCVTNCRQVKEINWDCIKNKCSSAASWCVLDCAACAIPGANFVTCPVCAVCVSALLTGCALSC